MNEELNNCPRCNAKARINEQLMLPGNGNAAEFCVSCTECNHRREWCATREDAVSRWNAQRPLVR